MHMWPRLWLTLQTEVVHWPDTRTSAHLGPDTPQTHSHSTVVDGDPTGAGHLLAVGMQPRTQQVGVPTWDFCSSRGQQATSLSTGSENCSGE